MKHKNQQHRREYFRNYSHNKYLNFPEFRARRKKISKESQLKHPEESKKYQKTYRLKHPEQIKVLQKKYHLEHPDYYKNYRLKIKQQKHAISRS